MEKLIIFMLSTIVLVLLIYVLPLVNIKAELFKIKKSPIFKKLVMESTFFECFLLTYYYVVHPGEITLSEFFNEWEMSFLYPIIILSSIGAIVHGVLSRKINKSRLERGEEDKIFMSYPALIAAISIIFLSIVLARR